MFKKSMKNLISTIHSSLIRAVNHEALPARPEYFTAIHMLGAVRGKKIVITGQHIENWAPTITNQGALTIIIDESNRHSESTRKITNVLEKTEESELINTSINKTTLLESSVDGVFVCEVNSNDSLSSIVEEMNRILKPNGVGVFVQTWNKYFISSIRKPSSSHKSDTKKYLRYSDIKIIQQVFPNITHQEFYLFSQLAFYWSHLRDICQYYIRKVHKAHNPQESILFRILHFVDQVAFFVFPFLKRFALLSVIRVQKSVDYLDVNYAVNMHKTKKSVFNQEYFTDYYAPMTGSFSPNDLTRNKNWFYGWFACLQDWYDFEQGNNKKVLEIGCSIGAAADILSSRGFKVCATDISPYAVSNAKKLLPHIEFNILDISERPTHNQGEYDLIYAFEVIEHLDDPKRCIENAYSLLKPGGVLICSTPYPYPYVYFDETHISVKYPKEWVEIFRLSGLKNVKYSQVGFIPFLYRYSKYLHFTVPFGLNTRYINSPVFVYGQK